MSDHFDPYHRWLGVPPKDQPPNHYRLLGLDLFEADVEVIRDATDQRMAHVRTYQLGPHSALSQKILNELATAKGCLLNPENKTAYDAELKEKLSNPKNAGSPPSPPEPELGSPPSLPLQETRAAVLARTWGKALGGAYARRKPLAIAVGTAVLFLVILAAFLVSRGRRDGGLAEKGPSIAQVARATGDKAIIHQQPTVAEKTTETAAAKSESSEMSPVQPSAEPQAPQPKPVEPAIYTVQVDPPTATLRVGLDRGTIFGTGTERTLTIEQPNQYGQVSLIAECEGYKKLERWLTPSPGTKDSLSISLEKETPPSQPTSFELPPGAVLILTFEENTLHVRNDKSQVDDLSGKGHVGILEGATSAEGKVGKGLRFRQKAYVEIAGDFPIGSQPRTVAVWVKDAAGAVTWNVCAISLGRNNKNKVFGILEAGGRWRFYDYNEGLDTNIAVDREWHHHCITYDGAEVVYYLDGRCVVRGAKSLATASGPLVLGSTPPKQVAFFKGLLDEVVMFDRALSADEVGKLYEMGVNGIPLAK